MRKLFCLTALCALLLLASSALAQTHLRSLGVGTNHPRTFSPDAAPPYCNPCLFYGGDWNNASSDWVIFANADEAGFGGLVEMYNAFKVPAGQTWNVTGLFANIGFINIDKMAPAQPEYAIRSGMSAGNGGTVIQQGKHKGKAIATGRTADSGAGPVVEYTVLVKGLTGISLPAGNYYEDVTPQCHATNDASCSTALYYESDTFNDAETNPGANHFGPKEPTGRNFQNSPVFGLDYVQINSAYCTSNGFPAAACNWMSAGVLGAVQ